jgi:hypothetical protein
MPRGWQYWEEGVVFIAVFFITLLFIGRLIPDVSGEAKLFYSLIVAIIATGAKVTISTRWGMLTTRK